jgi:hypothetical protein
MRHCYRDGKPLCFWLGSQITITPFYLQISWIGINLKYLPFHPRLQQQSRGSTEGFVCLCLSCVKRRDRARASHHSAPDLILVLRQRNVYGGPGRPALQLAPKSRHSRLCSALLSASLSDAVLHARRHDVRASPPASYDAYRILAVSDRCVHWPNLLEIWVNLAYLPI